MQLSISEPGKAAWHKEPDLQASPCIHSCALLITETSKDTGRVTKTKPGRSGSNLNGTSLQYSSSSTNTQTESQN